MKGFFMKISNKHLLALTVSAIYIIFVYLCIGICFSTNDDRFMGELLSGAITGKIETHLVYVNYLLSVPLTLLYHLSTTISWFGILLVLFHWFSCFCILDSFYSFSESKTDICISTILTGFLFMTELYLISQISYTMTASFMAIAGYVCLLLNRNKKTRFFYFIILELFAFLLRDKAMLMILPLGFAVFFGIVLLDKGRNLKSKFIEYFKIAGILIAIMLLGFIGNKIGYSNEDWKIYSEYNDARTELFDYSEFPPYEEVSYILEKYNVSEIEYNAYTQYAILDYTLSLDCINELADFLNSKQSDMSLSALFNNYKTSTFFEQYWQTNTISILGWICIVSFLLISGNFSGLIPLSFLFVGRTTIWLYLLYGGRLPLRVTMPLFAGELILLITIAFYFYINKKNYAKWQYFAFTFISCILIATGLWSSKIQLVRFSQTNSIHKIYMQSFHEVLDYCNQKPENTYITDTLSFMWYNGEAFDGSIYGKRNCITAGSWFSNAPSLLNGNLKYLNKTQNGLFFIMLSEKDDTDEEMNHPIVQYLAHKSGSTPYIADSFTASHGGTYSIIHFDRKINLNVTP